MASLARALRQSVLGKRYAVVEGAPMEGKENKAYVETPRSKKTSPGKNLDEMPPHLRRNTSFTKSVRDVVGSVKQKLRKSTRQRKRLQDTPGTPGHKGIGKKGKRTPTRPGAYREVKMYSPFRIETPIKTKTPVHRGIRTRPPRWHDVETPTRLRKEVEDLTANMQALVELTPRTLQTRSQSRKSLMMSPPPMTNGTLKTPKGSRRSYQIYRTVPTSEL